MQVFDLFRKKTVSLQPKIRGFRIIIVSNTNVLAQGCCEISYPSLFKSGIHETSTNALAVERQVGFTTNLKMKMNA